MYEAHYVYNISYFIHLYALIVFSAISNELPRHETNQMNVSLLGRY